MDVSASAGSPCPQFSVKRMEPPSVVAPRPPAGRLARRGIRSPARALAAIGCTCHGCVAGRGFARAPCSRGGLPALPLPLLVVRAVGASRGCLTCISRRHVEQQLPWCSALVGATPRWRTLKRLHCCLAPCSRQAAPQAHQTVSLRVGGPRQQHPPSYPEEWALARGGAAIRSLAWSNASRCRCAEL